MNCVNENTASALEGAEPRCSQRGVLTTFCLEALIPLAICYLCWQILIDPRCLGSAEGMVHSSFLSSLQVPSTIVVNETEGNFAWLPSAAESLQNLRDTKGGGSISALAAPLQPLYEIMTREAGGATSSPERGCTEMPCGIEGVDPLPILF